MPTLREAEMGESLEANSLRPAWATQEDLISTKIKIIKTGVVVSACTPSYSGG